MSDEDDDGEHYFLQPVKGYNIVEKIKLANEQLYELEIPYKRNKRSKVSFRENLVDFEPDCSSDDGYGESGTSTSDHETKKCNEKRTQMNEEACDLERELDNLRSSCKQEESCNKCASSDEEEIPDECNETSDEEIPDECESDNEKCVHSSSEEDEVPDECTCETKVKERTTKDCAECDIVEKVVAELVLKEVEVEDEADKPKAEPKKKKPLYKSKFGRFGRNNNDNTTFEVIETEHGRFRGCCRHKVEHIEGMPHYKGAVSLYGLSEEQYEKRETRLQKMEQLERQKVEKLKEDYEKKATETEDAFAIWMKQKAKSKPTRMKNMYDQKPKKPQNVKGQREPIKRTISKLNNNNNNYNEVEQTKQQQKS